jgi:dUTP pyrophosphatase
MILRYMKTDQRAMTPRRSHANDAGFDLAPIEGFRLEPGATAKFDTGCAFEMEAGFVGLLVARSSAKMRGLDITRVIDADYRGPVIIGVTNIGHRAQTIEAGAYLAQMLILPVATPGLELVTELSDTARGANGFGSSDRKPGNGG